MNQKQSRFNDLVGIVQNCTKCPRMAGRRRVLSLKNGNLESPIVFIAEAPGRLGADKYGIPLWGDQTGKNFNKLLEFSGIARDSIFITNVVVCNPRGPDGNNSTPTKMEIQNCIPFLLATLEIIQPKFIVTLGSKALTALNYIESHNIRLDNYVGELFTWRNFHVYPLYHPGPRGFIWRSKDKQEHDFNLLASSLKMLGV
jgi:uracil-DNA glycosylase family 4